MFRVQACYPKLKQSGTAALFSRKLGFHLWLGDTVLALNNAQERLFFLLF